MELLGTIALGIAMGFLLLAYITFKRTKENPSVSQLRRPPPPGNLGWPLLGETLHLLRCMRANRIQDFFEKRIKKYGDIFTTSIFGFPTVVFNGVEGNRFVFNNENTLLVNYWPTSLAKLFGDNSLLSKSGEDAKYVRKMLMKFLKPEALQKFVGRADSIVNDHVRRHWIGRQQVHAYPLIKRCMFSVACSLFVSLRDQALEDQLYHHFHNVLRGLVQIPLNVPGTIYHRALVSSKIIHHLLQQLIDQRKKDLQSGSASEEEDLLSYLLCATDDRGNSMTEDEIKNNVLLLLMGGHDTSVIVITFLMKYLSLNPRCYQQVLQEQMEIVRRMDEDERQERVLEWDDISRYMKYSWKAAQETLRLQPPAPGAWRHAIADISYREFIIPKGWKIIWSSHSTNRNGEYFRDPDKFDPSRFEGKGAPPYAFVPFGGGRRVCPGSEYARMIILVFLHNIVKYFQWDLVDVHEKEIGDPLPTPADGLHIKLRQHSQLSPIPLA